MQPFTILFSTNLKKIEILFYYVKTFITSKYRKLITFLRTMVAPPANPPANQITDLWGNVIGVNGALERIRELRHLLNEMEAQPDSLDRRQRVTDLDVFIYYNDEIENLENQLGEVRN
jgi:hypothetical protein